VTAQGNGWLPEQIVNRQAQLDATLYDPLTTTRIFFTDRGITELAAKLQWIYTGLTPQQAITAYENQGWNTINNQDLEINLLTHARGDLAAAETLFQVINDAPDSGTLMSQNPGGIDRRINHFNVADENLPEGARKADIIRHRNRRARELNDDTFGNFEVVDENTANYTSYQITTENLDPNSHARELLDRVHQILADINTKTVDNINDLADGSQHPIFARIEALTPADNAKLPVNRQKAALHQARNAKHDQITRIEAD
ncbi:10456_t:CDS:2, partial [Racocetra persica]